MKDMNRNIYGLFALCLLCIMTVSSCKDLDEAPDNRTEIDTVDKVQQLLTSGYPVSVPAQWRQPHRQQRLRSCYP